MLTQLSIRGLAIIENLSIDFSSRLNVITGETGAGKSILIKALGLVTGNKASADSVRAGFGDAQVTAIFRLSDGHRGYELLDELGLSSLLDDDGHLIVRRQVTAKGRSSAYLNDTPVTLQVLRQLGESLVDILSQHENHRLLDASQHIHYLDKFLPKKNRLAHYQRLYDEAMELLRDIESLVTQFQTRMRERDYLSFRLKEINVLEPSKEDFNELEGYCHIAGKGLELKHDLESIIAILDSGYQGRSLGEAFHDVRRLLAKIDSENFRRLGTELSESNESIECMVNDMSYSLGKYMAGLDFDEKQLLEKKNRLADYKDLMRKLGVYEVSELEKHAAQLRSQLEFIESAGEQITQKLFDLRKLMDQLVTSANALKKERRKAFEKVRYAIKSELTALHMKGASLEIDWSGVSSHVSELDLDGLDPKLSLMWTDVVGALSQVNRMGAEKVQFLLAANPGEAAKPLSKVASGGEISRIMLGIKKVLSAGAETCVMVFDEIDTGISGKTADIVGGKLKQMAESFQVLCISHLPQVAAYADTHFKVEKHVKKRRTESRINELSKKESAEEIARLLSGDVITRPSLANAKLLIESAQRQ
jgi:DNA repair protein RecN (Recombination protein N)